MKRWEIIEALFVKHNLKPTTVFDCEWVAVELHISTQEASELIQAYLAAQRGKRINTLYVLKRMPGTRTRTAEWVVGQRSKDIKVITKAFSNDIKRRFKRAIEPDLEALAEINPNAAKSADAMINAFVGSLIPLLEVVLEK
jgi:hypothetical protein